VLAMGDEVGGVPVLVVAIAVAAAENAIVMNK
jgi:hypothetical protein